MIALKGLLWSAREWQRGSEVLQNVFGNYKDSPNSITLMLPRMSVGLHTTGKFIYY